MHGDGAVGRIEGVKDVAAGQVVFLASGRQGETARGAVEQLGAQLAFQLADLARHDGVGYAQRGAGGRETAQFHDAAQGAQGGQLVHGRVPPVSIA
ncbi:hypothetical protein D3C81_1761380 [compost metagenome]